MKLLLCISIIFLGGHLATAQQNSLYSQYMFNKYELNPAYGGLDFSLSVTGVNRNQWSGLTGRPTNQNLNAHMPLYRLGGSVGLSLVNDKLGAISQQKVSGSFNTILETGIGLFSFGGKVGLTQLSIDGQVLRTPEGIYEGSSFDHNDPILQVLEQNGSGIIWGVGAYYRYRTFEFGLSLEQFPETSVSVDNIDVEQKNLAKLYAEYSYRYDDFIEITPSVLLQSDLVQNQLDISTIVNYQNQYFGGIGLRGYNANSLDAIIFIAGIQINKNYRFSYAFDLGISTLRNNHSGTHEFVLNYNLRKLIGVSAPPKIIYNPRFL